MQKYRCYGKDDFGNPYDAMSIKDEYGEWCKASEVDARIAELEKRLAHFEAGEYICAKCGLRQETPKQDAPF